MSKRKYILFDWEVKRLFREKANFEVVEGLLSVLLEDTIKIVEILESTSNQKHSEDKFNQVDVLAKTGNGDLVIIEVQNERELDYFQRILYGVSKVITERIALGQRYTLVKKVYSVSILYFELGQGGDYLYHGRTDFKGVFRNDRLKLSAKQSRQFHCSEVGDLYPEYYILRVNDFNREAVTPLDEWFAFLKTGEIPDHTTAPGLCEARERLGYDRMSDEERQEYDSYARALNYRKSVFNTGRDEGKEEGLIEGEAKGKAEGLMEGKAKGKAEGLIEGEAKGKAEIARSMLKDGLPVATVGKYTGLSEQQIEDLKAKHGL